MYLYLCSVSCCDVGNGPARLLPDGLLGTAEQVQETGESGAVQHHLQCTKQGTERQRERESEREMCTEPKDLNQQCKHTWTLALKNTQAHKPVAECHLQ